MRGAGPPRPNRRSDRAAAVAVIAGFVLFGVFSLLSKGFYHGDDCYHFLIAHDAWHSIDDVMNWWGRPGHTLPAMLAEGVGGLAGCRLLSTAMTALTAWLAYLIARRISPPGSRLLWLAPLFVWVQPLAAILAQTALTETAAALYLTLSVWLLLRGNRVLSCLAASLLFVTRYETLALAPILAVAVLCEAWRPAERDLLGTLRRPWLWLCAGAMLLFPVLYLGAAALLDLRPDVDPLRMFTMEYSRDYGHGGWFHFWPQWLIAAGGGVLALAAAGVVRLRSRAALPAALAMGLFLVHTLIYRGGSLSSGGYSRFLVPACGMLAALAAAGVHGLLVERENGCAAAAFLVLGLAAIGVSGRPELAAFGSALKVSGAVVIAAAVATVALRGARARRVASRTACLLALAAAAVQGAALIRPLTLAESLADEPESGPVWSAPLSAHSYLTHSAMHLALEDVRLSPHAGAPLFSTHGFVRCHDLRAVKPPTPEQAIDLWREAAPGAVFIWESGTTEDEATDDLPRGALFAELARSSTRLASYRIREFEVVVFVRR